MKACDFHPETKAAPGAGLRMEWTGSVGPWH